MRFQAPSVLALVSLAISVHAASLDKRNPVPPKALPKRATKNDLKWQPALDYDTDSCYNVPAIGADGKISLGLTTYYTTGSEECRDNSDLDNSNAYSRQRCNTGWCAYFYDYYFEKDVALPNIADEAGHTHDWEHIVVWVKDGVAEYVSGSAHGGYETKARSAVRWDGDHPKMVYHKDGASTHAFRFAGEKDDDIENHKGVWFRSDLVGYNGFPSKGLRQKLFDHDFGKANIGFSDENFASQLDKAQPSTIVCKGGSVRDGIPPTCAEEKIFFFDTERDADGSPGTPGDDGGGTNPPKPSKHKIMIIGDSITQGHEGDYTWRYRLWQWLKAEKVDFDFVGPFCGTNPAGKPVDLQPPPLRGESGVGDQKPGEDLKNPLHGGGYNKDVDKAFDCDHFSVWGRQIKQDIPLVEEQVRKYKPDIVLVLLGFNDMGWFVSDAIGTFKSMNELMQNIRKGNPDVTLLIGNVPQRSRLGGREDLIQNTKEYNSMLSKYLDLVTLPIELVDVAGHYSCGPDSCPAGYDGLHPGALGEFQIAREFSKVLVDKFKVGKKALAIPQSIPKRDTPTPTGAKLTVMPYGLKFTWNKVYGAHTYDVESKYKGGEWSSLSIWTNRWDNTWAVDGIEYSYRVRTNNGNDGKSSWSAIATATAKRETLDGPKRIKTYPTAEGARMEWDAVPGATRYELLLYDTSNVGSFIYGTGVEGTSIYFSDLNKGHTYVVALVVWNAKGPSFPSVAREVIPGRVQTPGVPSGFSVRNQDPTTVNMSWDRTDGAAGYDIYWRSHLKPEEGWRSDARTVDTSYTIGFLFPGTWNYEFCVAAYNGQYESGKSQCFTPPKI